MQHEFYPYLEELLNIFMNNILIITEADTIKNTFRCIGHLMKILWRPISQNLLDVYSILCPMFLFKNKDYIRYLGADTISFLYRKAKDKKEFSEFILSKVDDTTDPIAIAKLFFEGVKAVDGKFNFQLEDTLNILMEVLPGDNNLILTEFIKFVCDHTTEDFIKPIQVKLFDMMKQNCSNHLIFLDCLNILITTKHGTLVKDSAMFVDFLKSCTPTDKQPSANLFKCYSSLLLEDVEKSSDVYDNCIGLVTKSNFEVDLVCDLINEIIDDSIFDEHYLKPYLAWVQTNLDKSYDLICSDSSHICNGKSDASPKLGSDLENLHIFTFDFNLVPALRMRKVKKSDIFTNKILEKIDVSSSNQILKDGIVICRSFKQVDKADLTSILNDVFN
jgi:hypothetical protein